MFKCHVGIQITAYIHRGKQFGDKYFITEDAEIGENEFEPTSSNGILAN